MNYICLCQVLALLSCHVGKISPPLYCKPKIVYNILFYFFFEKPTEAILLKNYLAKISLNYT